MRYIRLAVILVFLVGLGIKGTAEVRSRFFTDNSYPVITSTSETISVPCAYSDGELLAGLSATDEKDGDITANILVGEISRFKEIGTSEVTYVVFDSDGHSSTYSRQVTFSDYQSPRFSLDSALVFREGEGGDVMESIHGSDLLDGDISGTLSLDSSDVNYQISGDYAITVSMYNSYGDKVEITLPVHVLAAADQQLDIALSSYLVYLSAGESLNPRDYLEDVLTSSGESLGTGIVSVDSSGLDTSTPGVYQVAYTASSRDGRTGHSWLTVVVE